MVSDSTNKKHRLTALQNDDSHLDTLVLGTANLARGRLWLEKFLCVATSEPVMQPIFGTQASFVTLSHTKKHLSLMLLAIESSATGSPAIPRWFGLDTSDVQERIAQRPRLIGWLARATSLDTLHADIGGILGDIHDVSMENGTICRVTNPTDGYPIEGGLIPQLIERITFPAHQTSAPQFTWMEAAHPNPARVQYLLDELGFADKFVMTASPPYSGMTMCAYIKTPAGIRTLMS